MPCSPTALATAISGASSGDALQLANCTYVLTTALPDVTTTLTIDGRQHHRAQPHRQPACLQPADRRHGGDLTTNKVSFTNGDGTTYGGAIYGEDGPVTVHGGTFSGNNSGEYGGAIYNDDGLTVTGATFNQNGATTYGGAI